MASSANERLFHDKVIPIMDKVANELKSKQADELEAHQDSFSFLAAGAVGPDGGMCAMQTSRDMMKYTSEWNSKTVEDYVEMVKTALRKQHIDVDEQMEKMMIDKMIKDRIPKSSIEYIIRKAATSSLYYIPQAITTSPLQQHIEDKAEEAYNPSTLEKGAGIVFGSLADWGTMGMGGGVTSAMKFAATDLAINAAMPLIIAPEHQEEYAKEKAERDKEKAQRAEQDAASQEEETTVEETTTEETPTEAYIPEEQPTMLTTDDENSPSPSGEQTEAQQTNTDGWTGLLTSFGLNGLGDIGHNLGYVLAMLPDILVGAFTGKSTSLRLKDNLLPIASIVAGMFVKNPILKIALIGLGGLNLLNKAGHEALDKRNGTQSGSEPARPITYRVYEDEVLNPRIADVQIKGNCLLATIDRIPCTIALPDHVVDAYQQGALPLNTLANAVLAKSDQMNALAGQNYENRPRNDVSEGAELRNRIR